MTTERYVDHIGVLIMSLFAIYAKKNLLIFAIKLKNYNIFHFQVHPTTLIIEECKEPYTVQLKLTPTIPVRKNSDGHYVYVTFYLPDGLWLVNNKDKCIVEIKETEEVKVSIGATCTTLHGLKNLKVISPKIMNQKGFWSFYGLPTIWVCIVFLFVFYHSSSTVQRFIVFGTYFKYFWPRNFKKLYLCCYFQFLTKLYLIGKGKNQTFCKKIFRSKETHNIPQKKIIIQTRHISA